MVQLSCQRFNRVHRFPNETPGFFASFFKINYDILLKQLSYQLLMVAEKSKPAFFLKKIKRLWAVRSAG
jgi:hypothetical protein